jgi:muconolactone D-isomerase
MHFLVGIQVDLPATLPEGERSELLAAELKRGRELRDAGAIVAIWRVPGPPLRNVGIWAATDATELHELLASLPLFPYIQAEVTPLAQHPIDANDEGTA